LLKVKNLQSGYGDLQILWNVNLEVKTGEIVALLGPNGAGKTTTMKAIMGLLPIWNGEAIFDDNVINNLSTYEITRLGLSYIPEDRRLFSGMTVLDNLRMGGYSLGKKDLENNLEKVFELFPRLKERKKQYAGTMSGGERQMLAVGRGLVSSPKMVIIDEPTLGLAPKLVEDVFDVLGRLQKTGCTILIIEQNVNLTLDFANRAYVLENGKINMEGRCESLLSNDYIKDAYLGA